MSISFKTQKPNICIVEGTTFKTFAFNTISHSWHAVSRLLQNM